MIRAAAVAAVVLVVATGCRKRADDDVETALRAMRGFADHMCACRDRACADRVQDEMSRFGQDMARSSRPAQPTEQQIKEMEEVGTRYATCMTKLFGDGTTTTTTAIATPELPPGPAPRTVDEMLRSTFATLPAGYTVSEIELSYVRADGTLDPTYGHAEISLAKAKKPKPADDPSRPIGAPVPIDDDLTADIMARCPKYSWRGGQRTTGEGSCLAMGEPLLHPRCSVLEVWKQAIEADAPASGLAILELRHAIEPGATQTWSFVIDDTPRNIHFRRDVPDTCDPTLEKPIATPRPN